MFTHAKSIWLASQCLLTGFADDAFSQFTPGLLRTQLVCVAATVSGLFFVSFVIGIISSSFVLNKLLWLSVSVNVGK
jgi:hypothetical protein